MGIKEIAEKVFASIKGLFLPYIEAEVKAYIEQHSDEQVDKILAKIKELIPGQLDDAIINQVAPQAKAEAKAFLLAQAEKIS